MSNSTRSHTSPHHITFLNDAAKTDFTDAMNSASLSIEKGSDATASTIQQVGMYAHNGVNYERLVCDSDGHLQVDIVSGGGGGGDASASNQSTQISLATSGNASLTSIDGKITACNTGAVVISSGSVTESNSAAILSDTNDITANTLLIAGDTTSLDAKITACNTGAVVVSSSALPSGASTSALQTGANSSLSAIESSVAGTLTVDGSASVQPVSASALPLPSGASTSALQTGANSSLSAIESSVAGTLTVDGSASVQPVSASALPLPSGASTSALQTSGNASLSAIQGSHYADGDSIAAADTGVLIMGRNGTNTAKPIHITNNGDVEVEIADFVKGSTTSAQSFPVTLPSDAATLNVKSFEVRNIGSRGNLANNVSISSGAQSSTVDVSGMSVCNVIYQDTATSSFDGLDIDISVDAGTNYEEGFASLFPSNNLAGTKRVASYMALDVRGITNIRLTNSSSTDTYTGVIASVVGSP